MAKLVARVGSHWVGVLRQKFCKGSPPGFCLSGGTCNFFQGYPPLLRGVQEVGTLVGMVAWVGTCLVGSGREVALPYLIARSPPQEGGGRGKKIPRVSPRGGRNP